MSLDKKPLCQLPNPHFYNQLIFPIVIWMAIITPVTAQTTRRSTPPPQPIVQASEGDGYILGAGDRLKIDIFNVQEFSGEYQVLPNGTVNLPLVGAVGVQGRTLGQAERAISARYNPVLQQPVITVSLLVPRPIRVAVSGEVNRPGTYTVPAATGATEVNVPSLTRTIQLAEGVTQAADLRNVQIRRKRPVGNTADEVIQVNLWELLRTGNLQQDVRLQDGDSILIPATTAVNLEEAQQLAAANFAARNNRPLKITVVGQVNRPGPYTLIEGAVGQRDQLINPNLLQVPSVTRAIQVAGGITQQADIRNIQVRRLTRLGAPQVIKLDFWKLLKGGDVLQDLPLQDGDTIEIPVATLVNDSEITELATASFSPDRITVNISGEVERPGAVSLQPNTPLNQAILTAGGFTRKAVKREVTLIRLNPNGTVTKRDVAINLEQGVNDQNNPALRNNDIIIVRKTGFSTFIDRANDVLGPITGLTNFFRIFGF
ncbi:periplasmic protein involved in polysaccharide export [Leptolyngbyaceae cyanobacterium JSC-12]|nr:periplasmic protein involved in polysaccharide export [Leptolyngbyaceae cyanobacterium JSC-12]